MKPLALVAGFLGSGKTTFLKRILENHRDKRLLFLINEFADDEIDATLVEAAGGLSRAVAGGSVFCECRADAFKDVLVEAAGLPEVDGVVVEASGMAEPRAMGRILADPRLSGQYEVSALIAVVDPLTFPKLRHTLPAASGQIAGADVVLVNKCDLAAPDTVETVKKQVREITPSARIIETVRADFAFDTTVPLRKEALGDEVALTNAGARSFASLIMRQSAPVSLEDFEKAIADLGNLAYRIKGWLQTPDQGRLFVELDAPGRPLSHTKASKGPGRLVVIVGADAIQAAKNRLTRLPGVVIDGE